VDSGTAVIHQERCDACGICRDYCRYGAVYCRREKGNPLSDTYYIDDLKCVGCDACAHFCPSGAIDMKKNICGSWYISESESGPLIQGRLSPGLKAGSRQLLTLREQARELACTKNIDLVIASAPTGNGGTCLSLLDRAGFALLTVESSVVSMSVLERIAQAAGRRGVPFGVCFLTAGEETGKLPRAPKSMVSLGMVSVDSLANAPDRNFVTLTAQVQLLWDRISEKLVSRIYIAMLLKDNKFGNLHLSFNIILIRIF